MTYIDWDDRIAYVEPATDTGKSRWPGTGPPLHYELCQAIRRVLLGSDPAGTISNRAKDYLALSRAEFGWLDKHATVVLRDDETTRWWSFAGLRANAALAAYLRQNGVTASKSDNFWIDLGKVVLHSGIESTLSGITQSAVATMGAQIEEKTLESLKFSQCLPRELAELELRERLTDREGIKQTIAAPVVFRTDASG